MTIDFQIICSFVNCTVALYFCHWSSSDSDISSSDLVYTIFLSYFQRRCFINRFCRFKDSRKNFLMPKFPSYFSRFPFSFYQVSFCNFGISVFPLPFFQRLVPFFENNQGLLLFSEFSSSFLPLFSRVSLHFFSKFSSFFLEVTFHFISELEGNN